MKRFVKDAVIISKSFIFIIIRFNKSYFRFLIGHTFREDQIKDTQKQKNYPTIQQPRPITKYTNNYTSSRSGDCCERCPDCCADAICNGKIWDLIN